ncbi:MAG: hypothetical protein R3230_00615 [Nitrosopumilaceae archaeon]|nr:hypothetical protein [Nitrosopumilaceae archaeon]
MAKGSKKKTSAANTRYFNAYNPEKQRKARLARHLKRHPNDAQANKASTKNRRKAPLNKLGWLTREMANKIYIGKAIKDIDAVTIVNSLSPQQRVKMAQAHAQLRKITNRLSYKKDKKPTKLGYAG